MALEDVSQIQRMVRAVLQRVDVSSGREDANGGALRLPQGAAGATQEASASPETASASPSSASDTAQPASVLRTDSVRVSDDAQRQLADQVLRVLSEATRSATNGTPATASLSSRALDTVLADAALRSEIVSTFSQPAVAERIPEFLADPDLQQVTARLVAHEDMSGVASRLIQSTEATSTLSQLLTHDTTRDAAITLLSRGDAETVARDVIARDTNAETLARVIESPQGRAVVARVIADNPDAAPRVLEALSQNPASPESIQPDFTRATLRDASSNVLTLARPELRAAAPSLLQNAETAQSYLRILAEEPGGTELARELLATAATRDAFRATLTQPETAENALRILTDRNLTDVARDLAAQPQSETLLREALATETGSASDRLALTLVRAMTESRSADLSATETLENFQRLLANDATAETLTSRFADSPQWRRALLDALTQLPSGDDARNWIERPTSLEALGRYLASPEASADEANRTGTIRLILSAASETEGSGSSTIRTLFESTELADRLSAMLGKAETRLTAADALARPELADVAMRILNSPEGVEALRTMVITPEALPAATRLLSQPQTAEAVLTQMAQSATSEVLAEFLRNPEFQRRLPQLLANSETARPALEIIARAASSDSAEAITQAVRLATSQPLARALPDLLASTDTRALALEILSRPETTGELARVLETPQATEALTRALQSGAQTTSGQAPPQETSLALRILAHADSAEAARLLFAAGEEAASGAREALTRILAEAFQRTDSLRNADLTNTLRLLGHDTAESAAREILQRPEAMDQLARWMSQPQTRTAALELIQRPSMADVLQRVLQHPDARNALVDHALAAGSGREITRLLTDTPESARAVLTGMARPENAAATQRLLATATLQNEATRLLFQPATREAFLDILARPEFAARTVEMLSRQDVQLELIQTMSQEGVQERLTAILNAVGGSRAVEQLVSRPELLQAALRTLSESPQTAAATLNILRQSASDSVVTRFLESSQWQEAASRLLGDTATREAALGLLARTPSDYSLRATLATPEGEAALRAALQPRSGLGAERATTQTDAALRLLARPEMGETLARFASEPEFQQLMVRLATRDATRSSAVRLLQTPEMQDVSRVLFNGRGGERLALDLVSRHPGAPEPAEILRSPESSEALLRSFLRTENGQTATRVLQAPEAQARLAQMLQTDPSLRASILRVLDSPQRTDAATRVFAQPETLARVPEFLQAPSTTASTLRILGRIQQNEATTARDTLQEIFRDSRTIEGVSRLFIGHAATHAETTPGSAIHTTLRVLASPSMGEAARQVFESPEARAALARILGDAVHLASQTGAAPASASPAEIEANVGEILRLLERPELAGATHRLLDTPEVRTRLADLLAGVPQNGRLASPDNAQSILRILSRPETADAARDVLARTDVQERLPFLLHDTRTRSSALQLLLRPELADLSTRVFNTPEGRQVLLETLAAPESTARTIAQILTSPATSRTAVAALATIENTQTLDRLLARPEVQESLPRLLQDTGTRDTVLRLLARPEHAETGGRILQSPGLPEQISESVASRRSDASYWLQILARPEARETARAWLERPANTDALRALIVESPESRDDVFRLLTQPAAREAAARVFSTPEAVDTLTRAATQTFAAATSETSVETAQLQTQALRILAQTEMAETLRAIVSQSQNQAAIATALSRDENRQVLLAILTELRHRDTARVLIQRTEVRQALVQALRNEGVQRIADLLQDNEIAARVLEAIRQGDTEALQRILATENGMRRITGLLSQPQPRQPLLQILSAPENASAALRLLSRPGAQSALMPLLESGEARPWIQNLLQSVPRELAPILSQLATIARPASGTSQETADWLQGLLTQAGRSRQQPTVLSRGQRTPGLLSRINNATRDEVVAALVNGASGAATPRGSLSWVFDNLPMAIQRLFGPMNPLASSGQPLVSRTTLNHVADAAERLHDVSPRRSQHLMRTLAVLSRLGGRNLDTVLQQIAGRVETMAQQLAQKGGLPVSLTEPTLAQSSLLMIRLPGLATGQFAPLVEALVANGIEIAFVGRDSTGTAQIQVQLAELPPGSPERPDSLLPGVTRHANLTPVERARLANVLTLDRPGRTEGWTHGGVLGSASSESSEREEIAFARARQVIQIERLQVRTADPNTAGTAAPRPEVAAATTFAFNYNLAAMFPWFNFSAPVPPTVATTAKFTEDGEVIPSMLDLVAMEPLLLTYELDELLGDEVTVISEQARNAAMS